MSWQDRPYASGGERGGGGGGGMRSWFGGLPSPGKAVKWIAVANIGMFLLCQFSGREASPFYEWLCMKTPLVLKGQVWRIFTFTYLHDQGGLFHVFVNMLGLYFLGMPLERHWGGKRFFVFYTLGGLAAVCLYFTMTVSGWLPQRDAFGRMVSLVGASGGVLAVLGACAVLFPQFRIIMVLFPVPIRTAALILVVLYTFNLINQGSNAGGDACHLAGLAFGVAWGYRGHLWSHRWGQWRANMKRGAWDARHQEQHALDGEVDQILEKVQNQGINSLTRLEKRKLQAATKLHQEEDRRHQV